MEAMEQMLQQITEHSAYMDTLQDRAVLAQEMLEHQKRLDQMLALLQQWEYARLGRLRLSRISLFPVC